LIGLSSDWVLATLQSTDVLGSNRFERSSRRRCDADVNANDVAVLAVAPSADRGMTHLDFIF
jgi:hypothetical protein